MKSITRSKTLIAGVAILGIVVFAAFLSSFSGETKETYIGPEFDLRRLMPAELKTLGQKGLGGDCIAAYKVARYHMFYSLDEAQAIIFFRIASKCPNANAHASLISLLVSKPEYDAEVDRLLGALRKLDIKMAQEASVAISHQRSARDSH